MEDKTHIRLTAAEMSSLWGQYINDTLAFCVSTYFLEKVEDEEVQPIIEQTLKIAKTNLSIMQDIFKKEEFPIPIGFTDKDVNPEAPRLFSDTFVLMYLRHMSILAMAASPRRDLGLKYASLIPEISLYAEDGANIMIKHGWMEEPPQADDRDQLIQN